MSTLVPFSFGSTASAAINNPELLPPPPPSGGWKELGRTTLCATGDNITVSCLPDKKYYMVMSYTRWHLNARHQNFRFNCDTGNNYAVRYSYSHGSCNILTCQSKIRTTSNANAPNDLSVTFISNIAGEEKLLSGNNVNTLATGGNKPITFDFSGKWTNTTCAINSITIHNDQAGNFNTCSEVVVLGWDPDDTHTDNFWEEVASVELCADGALSTCTITNKKYLWVQSYVQPTGSCSVSTYLKINNSSCPVYPSRYSKNGGISCASSGASYGGLISASFCNTAPVFTNTFIINTGGQEPIIMSKSISAATAGAANAPERSMVGSKWISSSPITQIDITNNLSVNWLAGSILKVWGSN
jgi:hypothetical protein